ncbi:hypothetical protein [Pseudoxanthomonas sp. CF125]|uniref:hypothetical protein n=1 Tax=Pseudoxanthomonas sp. CF125 TaxID=1855303 RepID=UPI00088FFBE5|nr:hypothetical protein [Pseudoxanthomonas sp. CF125]SDQ87644.1 hypothetical protein SAMN05216569_2397 [Pseudoxanthomonas sp. CF125]
MLPLKTEQARLALQSHAGPLSMRERRALILCDGRRNLEELTVLLGPDAPALIGRLHETGYLATDASIRKTLPAPTPAPAAAPALSPPPAAQRETATGARRSLVGAKFYMLGMLELQRHESAAAHHAQLRASQDPDATVAHLLASLHCLQRTTNASMVQRVRERLAEVLPEDYLPALEKLNLATPQSISL